MQPLYTMISGGSLTLFHFTVCPKSQTTSVHAEWNNAHRHRVYMYMHTVTGLVQAWNGYEAYLNNESSLTSSSAPANTSAFILFNNWGLRKLQNNAGCIGVTVIFTRPTRVITVPKCNEMPYVLHSHPVNDVYCIFFRLTVPEHYASIMCHHHYRILWCEDRFL